MKEVEKLKKRIKITKWLNKYLGIIISCIVVPVALLSQIIVAVAPFVGCLCMISVLLIGTIGGFLHLNRYQDKEYLHFLERELYYAETATPESVEVLNKTISDLQQNTKKVKDEETTRSLIRELIKIKKVSERVLAEQTSKINVKIKQKNKDNNIAESSTDFEL